MTNISSKKKITPCLKCDVVDHEVGLCECNCHPSHQEIMGETKPTESMEQWEKEFYEKFDWIGTISDNLASEFGEECRGDEDIERVKAFIHKVRQEAINQTLEDVEGWAKKEGSVNVANWYGDVIDTCNLTAYLQSKKK